MTWKILPFVLLSLGLALTVWLVSAASLSAVVESVREVGWGALGVVAVRATMIALNGLAWGRLLANVSSVRTRMVVLSRWIREAVDVLLPVAGIGGGLVGARTLTFWNVPAALAIASVAADLLLQSVAQALFALVGAACLVQLVGASAVLSGALVGFAAVVAMLCGFYVVQRHGARFINRAFVAVAERLALRTSERDSGFRAAIESLWHGRRPAIVAALALHGMAWTAGTLEVLITLHFMGWPVTLEQAIILESLGASISSAAFFIPGSWGAQEGGYLLIGQMLGLPPHFALALSLVKRIPDFALGIPGLVAWQATEARRLLA